MATILFDIGGPILPEEKLYTGMLQSALKALREGGVDVSDEEFDAAVRTCILSFVPGLPKPLVWHFTKPNLELYSQIVSRVEWYRGPREIRAGIRELLEELVQSHKLALAANARSAIRDVLAEHDVLKYFTSVQVSGDLPFSKPDPRFFESILSGSGARPEDTIMIGDRLDNDIIPAKLLGFQTILYKTGPYSILEPRTPDEAPDVTVTSIDELRCYLYRILN